MAKSGKSASKKDVPKAVNGGSEAPTATVELPLQDKGAAAPASGPSAARSATQPQLKILGQYLKDLSFENPNAPQSLNQQSGPPEINISVNVNARPLAAHDYEVELHLEAKASSADKVVFAAELLYAGVFRLENVPQEALQPVVLIECPRMLFPFARQVLADATRNGGFPPLMLDPIDFAGMYHRRAAQAKSQTTASPQQA